MMNAKNYVKYKNYEVFVKQLQIQMSVYVGCFFNAKSIDITLYYARKMRKLYATNFFIFDI